MVSELFAVKRTDSKNTKSELVKMSKYFEDVVNKSRGEKHYVKDKQSVPVVNNNMPSKPSDDKGESNVLPEPDGIKLS